MENVREPLMGCRFSLAVMSDAYAEMILGALGNVDTQRIQSTTDALSTTYFGKRNHVLEAMRDCFVNVNDGKTHITMEATLSTGWHGSDTETFPESDVILKLTGANFNVIGKAAFYSPGTAAHEITHVIDMAKNRGLFVKESFCAIELAGGVNELFDYFNEVMAYAQMHEGHFVLQATLSVNSPSTIKGGKIV